jgi:hypothetical protein
MPTTATLTQDRLKEILRYNPDTGDWTWLQEIGARCNVGAKAGCDMAGGSVRIMVDGNHYSGHRLAFFYMSGEWPAHRVGYVDGDSSNNQWSNLKIRVPKSSNVKTPRPPKPPKVTAPKKIIERIDMETQNTDIETKPIPTERQPVEADRGRKPKKSPDEIAAEAATFG